MEAINERRFPAKSCKTLREQIKRKSKPKQVNQANPMAPQRGREVYGKVGVTGRHTGCVIGKLLQLRRCKQPTMSGEAKMEQAGEKEKLPGISINTMPKWCPATIQIGIAQGFERSTPDKRSQYTGKIIIKENSYKCLKFPGIKFN